MLFRSDREDHALGWVYGWNTFGAMAGCLGAAFAWMPLLGLRGALLVCGGANLACAALFLAAGGIGGAGAVAPKGSPPPRRRTREGPVSILRLRTTLFLTGFFGIGLEVVGVRALSMVHENTLYSFATSLAVYLLATFLGAWAFERWGRSRHPVDLLSWVLAAASLGVLLGAGSLPRSRGLFLAIESAPSLGWLSIPAAEVAIALLLFFLPCLAMGACFSHLVTLARTPGRGIGPAVGWNYAGAAIASLVFGVWLLPWAGFKWTFLLVASGYLALVPSPRTWSFAVALGVGLVVGLLPADLHLTDLPSGTGLVESRVGAMATVTVVRDERGDRTLRVNNRFQMGGTSALVAQRRQAHLPLLLHPSPRRALFLGPGTGVTLGAATLHTNLVIDAVELVPEVLEVLPRFAPENRSPDQNPSVHLIAADARRFVKGAHDPYDVIVADLFHPARDGAGFLYTREHFQAIRNRLAPGGLFCQWLPLHQIDLRTWEVIRDTFASVFSRADVWILHYNVDIPVLGLIGRVDAAPVDWAALAERRLREVDPAEMRATGFANAVQLLGCHVGRLEREGVGMRGRLNTDDFPRVTFLAPWVEALPGAGPADTLLAVLDGMRAPGGGAAPGARGGADASPLVREYVAARDHYLHGLARESAGKLPEAIDLYFQSVGESLYFTPSYARLVGVIQVMAQADRPRARQLYDQLLRSRPDQPLGQRLLGELFDSPSTKPPPP